jgi:PAS domain S-box-containing protein
MLGRRVEFRPFAARGRRAVGAILLIFTLFSGLSLFLSISTTTDAKHRAAIVQVAARQRTLAERYAKNVLLVREGAEADPGATARALAASAAVLLDGGIAPSVDGDDDDTLVPRENEAITRSQLKQEQRLVHDLVATGSALLVDRTGPVRLTAGEHLSPALSPTERLTVLTGLTSNVSLNVARTIGRDEDTQLNKLMTEQILLSGLGLLVFGVLSWALVTTTRRQSAHFRSLVTSTTDLVLAFSEARCRYASQSVLGMLGRTEPEILDTGFVDSVHPRDRARFLQALAGDTPPTIAFRLPAQDGGWRDLEAHVTDLRGDRHVRCVVLNARDVTERNRADAEREGVLVQEKLANDKLRELDVMKDEFVALVSHELRTPLTAIKGYTELVLDGTAGELNDEQRMMLTAVDRSSARLFRLINDLLFVAQVNAGKLSVALEDVDLAAVARESIEDARPRAAAAGVLLEFGSTSTPTVKADRVRLGQVFDNLISNAIKFTPAGGRVGLTISMVGAEAIVVVTDSGMGMSAEDQQRLFTRFFRTKAAGKIQGTGLGLSITKAIVEAHNGSISVESEVGSGTSFTFTVPTTNDAPVRNRRRSTGGPPVPVD